MFDLSNSTQAFLFYKQIPCDNLTPLSLTQHFNAKLLLESAYEQTGKDRYSIIMPSQAFRIYKEDSGYSFLDNNQKIPLKNILQDRFVENDFLANLSVFREFAPDLSSVKCSESKLDLAKILSELPLPLGGAGYLGYEFFSEIEDISFTKSMLYDAPQCAFFFGRDFLIFDHLFDVIHIISISYKYEKKPFDVKKSVESIAKKLDSIKLSNFKQVQNSHKIINATTKESYESMVEHIKSEIYKGNLLQAVPSQSMQIQSNIPPLQAYRNLRHNNPSPYMFYYDFDDFVVFGASPETLIKLKSTESKTIITLKPIAGTRKRGKSVAQDLALEKELLSDEKENAEHLMLVDLARNDVGKVSIGGSVKVVQRNKIERYSSVMHIVSTVQGELDSKFSKVDALKAAFPAGTLSGAPKIQAIKTIQELESNARGIYGGGIGYFSKNGDMDFAIAIRSGVYQKGIYYLQSGAGVVYDSIPQNEYKETQNKIKAMFEAIIG